MLPQNSSGSPRKASPAPTYLIQPRSVSLPVKAIKAKKEPKAAKPKLSKVVKGKPAKPEKAPVEKKPTNGNGKNNNIGKRLEARARTLLGGNSTESSVKTGVAILAIAELGVNDDKLVEATGLSRDFLRNVKTRLRNANIEQKTLGQHFLEAWNVSCDDAIDNPAKVPATAPVPATTSGP